MGKLIVLEGLDGSGKATQTARVGDKLKMEGSAVRQISFPNYESPSSALVKMYLGGEFGNDPASVNPYQASMFYAADRVAGYLKDWNSDYKRGTTILTDRYVTSNIIYQMTKLPKSQWDDFMHWLEDFEYTKLELPRPDAVIYLDVEPEVSQMLLSERYSGDTLKKDIHEKNISFLKSCRETALYAASALKWKVIICTEKGHMRPAESITQEILTKILE